MIEKVAEIIESRKLPPLVDVRDESTTDVRVVLELKKDSDPELVMAYLFKHTPLQSNVTVNLTCLVPTDKPLVSTPERLDLKGLLSRFVAFREETIRRRLTHELSQLEKRLHVLEGFEKVFDALDEILKLIRASDGRADAAAKIMSRFGLTEEQTDAILELRLYRLAKLEILLIRKEADEKRKEARRLASILKSRPKILDLLKSELEEIKKTYADKRRTRLVSQDRDPEFSETDFIVAEDAYVLLTARGWVKRQQTIRDLSQTRVKEGDRVLSCVIGSTRASVAFFTNFGTCYVTRIAEIPASTGYGDPVQKLFKFGDGEQVVAALSFDPRVMALPEEEEVYDDGTPCPPYGVAVTRKGLAFRFLLFPHRDPSTRSGRRFARVKDGDEIATVFSRPRTKKGTCSSRRPMGTRSPSSSKRSPCSQDPVGDLNSSSWPQTPTCSRRGGCPRGERDRSRFAPRTESATSCTRSL
ncbi:MAG: hypothetical protein HC923_06195 [Myxococcales bacterium]|nr:hypothetical protein [Myxococcales bacterium]